MINFSSKPTNDLRDGLKSAATIMGGLGVLITLFGCQPVEIVPPTLSPPAIETSEVPDYVDLVTAFNANAASLERVFARTDVEMRWRTAEGKARRESGDGRFIFERPLNTAMTVEVLGDVKLWVGSDEAGFWMFDDFDQHVAYYGQYGRPLAQGLPLPVQPEAIPYLLGLMPIDPSRRPSPPEVESVLGYHVIEPPGLNLRLMLHPETARPARIDLTDPQGESVVVCLLSGETYVGSEDNPLAVLPAKAELYPLGNESRLTVELSRPTTDSAKIMRRFFAFDLLAKSLKPERVIDLNQPTP